MAIAVRSATSTLRARGVLATRAATASALMSAGGMTTPGAIGFTRTPGPSATARLRTSALIAAFATACGTCEGQACVAAMSEMKRIDPEERASAGAAACARKNAARGPARKIASQSAGDTEENGFGIHGDAAWTRSSRRGEEDEEGKREEEKISSNSLRGALSSARSARNASARLPSSFLRKSNAVFASASLVR